jgi:hypothetical protein
MPNYAGLSMTRTALRIATCFPSGACLLHAAERRKIATISYADFLDTSITKSRQFSSKDGIAQTFHNLKAQNYTHIYWRVSGESHPLSSLYYFNSAAIDQFMAAAKEYANTPYAWEPYELRWPVEAAHRQGLNFTRGSLTRACPRVLCHAGKCRPE